MGITCLRTDNKSPSHSLLGRGWHAGRDVTSVDMSHSTKVVIQRDDQNLCNISGITLSCGLALRGGRAGILKSHKRKENARNKNFIEIQIHEIDHQ